MLKKLSLFKKVLLLGCLLGMLSVQLVYAIATGDTINYTSNKTSTGTNDAITFKSGKYIGTCIEIGNPAVSSGTATVTKLSASSKISKVAYYIHKKNWIDNDTVISGYSTYSYAMLAEHILQIANMGKDDWVERASQYGYDSNQRAFIISTYDDAVDTTVPSYFEVLKCNESDGHQDFALWRIKPFTSNKTYTSGTVGAGGAQVKPGDQISYTINWSNNADTVTVTDTLGAGLEFVSASPSATSVSGQTIKWSGLTGETGTITYIVKVAAGTGGTTVCNSATAKSGSTTKTLDKLCNPVVEFNANKTYASGSVGAGGAQVKIGQVIDYTINWSGGDNVTVTDILGTGLDFVSATPTPTSVSGQTITWSGLTGGSGTIAYKARVNINAAGTTVCNNATAASGTNTKTLEKLCNPIPEFTASKKYASDTPSGNNNATVKGGDTIKYNISWANGYGTMTIIDTLSKGLSYVSGSASIGDPTIRNNSDGSTTLTWTTTQESGNLTYSAKVTTDLCGLAITQVKNNASMTFNGTSRILAELKNPVPSKCYASDSASGKDNSAVKVGDVIKYSIKYANVTTASQTAVVTDTLSKGLIYESGSANFGNPTITNNSNGTTTLVWNRTLAAGASEELTYRAKVTKDAGYVVNNGARVKIGNSSEVVLNPLENPLPKKEYGGTGLSDNPGWNHHEVLMPDKAKGRLGDDIKYKVTLANVKNVAQTVVVTDVLSKGLTYNNDVKITNGTITSSIEPNINNETKETTMVWTVSIPARQTAVLNYSAKVNEDAINIVNNNASATYSGESTIQLKELHNPVPRKKYDVNTANGMNGKIVQKKDVITYNISYANAFTNEATINLRDTLSKGLTYKAGTAKVCDYNKENCKSLSEIGMTEKVTIKTDGKTEILWTRAKMPSLGVEIIVYDVTVTGETIKVQNDFDIRSCEEATEKTETILDCQEQINPNCAPRCTVGTDENCKAETDTECTTSRQECSVTGLVCSNPWMDIEELKNPVPIKEYAEDTPSGYGEIAVAKRDRIKYRIRYANVYEDEVTVTINDTLSEGLTYVKGSSKVGNKQIEDPTIKGQQLTWTRKLAKDQEESLTYEVLVNGSTLLVNNKACMIYSNNPDYERCLTKLFNPVPQKTYSKTTEAGYNGAVVKKNDIITYSIKYSNVKEEKQTIIITDNLSKGLEYKKGTAKINGKSVEPDSVTKDANGTMLIWMTELKAGEKAELVYGAKVTGEKMIVENDANIQYGHDPVIHLNELRNPLLTNQVIRIPDTGSQIATIGVVAGVTLVGVGGYLIYRRYKKA